MHLIINNWIGRLGNNINQVKNCIQIALYYNYHILNIPYHPYFNTTIIRLHEFINDEIIQNYEYINIDNNQIVERNKCFNKSIYKNINIEDDNDFFYESEIKNIDINIFNLNIDLTSYVLKKIFKIKGNINLDDNDIIIHVRSGDIFNNKPHPSYIMPPLSYYTNILDNNNFNKIFLIAEDTKNPVIKKLVELYPNIIFKINNLYNDIELILSSKNIIESFGSFTKTLLLLSDNVKNIYKPSYQYSFLYNSEKYKNNIIKIYNIELSDYRNKINNWKNTLEQREIMLTYKFSI